MQRGRRLRLTSEGEGGGPLPPDPPAIVLGKGKVNMAKKRYRQYSRRELLEFIDVLQNRVEYMAEAMDGDPRGGERQKIADQYGGMRPLEDTLADLRREVWSGLPTERRYPYSVEAWELKK